jgi:S-DNA-T family DNA segregation ATPase FtsK/SpoIIIE|tara:strand:- start:881 stop:3511 length:2631 start_codon:yes stop_codon:yes gene_type:complete
MARRKPVLKNKNKSADPAIKSTSKTKKVKATPITKGPNAITKLMADSRTPKVLGLGLIMTSLFLLVSAVSHYFSYAHDAVLMEGTVEFSLDNAARQYQNYLGKLGALAGDFFVKKGFGFAVFIPIILLGAWGAKVLKPALPFKMYSMWIKGAFLSFWICIAASFPFLSKVLMPNGDTIIQDSQLLGGGVGFGLSLWLKNIMGTLGTALLLLLSMGVFLIVSYDGLLNKLVRSFSAFQRGNSKPVYDESAETNSSNSLRSRNLIDENSEEVSNESDLIDDILAENEDPDELDNLINDISSDHIEEKLELKTPESETTIEPELASVKEEKKEDDFETVTKPVASTPPDTDSELDVEIAIEQEEVILSEVQIDKKVQEFGEYDPKLDLSRYELPSIDILAEHGSSQVQINKEELEVNKNKIVETLNNYKIEISKIKATVGPTVTLYEIIPAPGVRISKIKNLEDDIALSLAALGIRIIAPIPGKGTIGIEVPNSDPQIVSMKKLIASDKFQNSKMELPIALGKTISNETLIVDLAKMPHLLMAGATGQGKSVGLNAILVSLLYKKHPAQIKFVLVDPKKVELTLFNKIERHYLAKLPDEEEAIITDVSKVVKTLNSLCIEMDQRYELLKNAMVRNIKEYNVKFVQRKLNPENGHKYMPYIVLVVDEFADLIMTAGKEVETPIARLAQLARAIGIHLIIATQRPSVNIITGTIKANFPARIAFRVTSKIDSRTILDAGGADQLIGRGDMLYSTGSELIRLQCGFVDTPEVDEICDFIGSQQGYPTAFILPEFIDENAAEVGTMAAEDRDSMFDEAARLIVMHQQGSTSLIQRKLKLGYNRAGRIIDQLEAAGIVGPFEGSKARKVLVPDDYSLEQLLGNN